MSIRRAERTLERMWVSAVEGLPEERSRGGGGGGRRQGAAASDVESGTERARAPRLSNVNTAPRLRGPGCCIKAVAVLCVATVCATLGVGVVSIASLPSVIRAEAALAGAVGRTRQLLATTTPAPEPPPRAPTPLPAPMPAILRRLRLIQRAAPPARGADAASVRRAFPSWGGPGGWQYDEVIADLVFALSTLAEPRMAPQ